MAADLKKTVLIVGKLPPPYMGPAIATQILLNSDLKNRYRLIHFNNTVNKTIDTQGKAGIGKVFKTIAHYLSFRIMLRRNKPDLILIPISQTTIGFLKDMPYILIAKWFGKKVLIQLRGSNLKSWLGGSSKLIGTIFSWTIKGTDGVIVLGDKLRHLFEDYFSQERIFVAPNGGDYSFPECSESQQKLTVLYFANMFESKGVRVVLDAALELGHDGFKFRFAGGWSDDAFKEKFLKDAASSAADIEIYGPLSGDRKFGMFANADIFVFPPIMPEGHPWVLVEAMAAGLPIIATDQGAITESVIDGENGFIVPAGDHHAIAEKLNILKNDWGQRERMAQESRRMYEARFTAVKLADNYENIFNTVIQKH